MKKTISSSENRGSASAREKQDADLEVIHNLNLILGCEMNRQQLAISAELIGLGIDAESIAEGKFYFFFL